MCPVPDSPQASNRTGSTPREMLRKRLDFCLRYPMLSTRVHGDHMVRAAFAWPSPNEWCLSVEAADREAFQAAAAQRVTEAPPLDTVRDAKSGRLRLLRSLQTFETWQGSPEALERAEEALARLPVREIPAEVAKPPMPGFLVSCGTETVGHVTFSVFPTADPGRGAEAAAQAAALQDLLASPPRFVPDIHVAARELHGRISGRPLAEAWQALASYVTDPTATKAAG